MHMKNPYSGALGRPHDAMREGRLEMAIVKELIPKVDVMVEKLCARYDWQHGPRL
jgi:hypothetical protein